MAPKRSTANPSSSTSTPSKTPSTSTIPSSTSSSSSTTLSSKSSPQEIAVHVYRSYLRNTPSRTKLLDVFMAWLVVVGGVQFAYCVVGGNYPFNAFLSAFSAAVGQFVLTASLRMQITSPAHAAAATSDSSHSRSSSSSTIAAVSKPGSLAPNPTTASKDVKGSEKASGEVIEDLGLGGKGYSPERAFADYVLGSLILHLFCVNFIN